MKPIGRKLVIFDDEEEEDDYIICALCGASAISETHSKNHNYSNRCLNSKTKFKIKFACVCAIDHNTNNSPNSQFQMQKSELIAWLKQIFFSILLIYSPGYAYCCDILAHSGQNHISSPDLRSSLLKSMCQFQLIHKCSLEQNRYYVMFSTQHVLKVSLATCVDTASHTIHDGLKTGGLSDDTSFLRVQSLCHSIDPPYSESYLPSSRRENLSPSAQPLKNVPNV